MKTKNLCVKLGLEQCSTCYSNSIDDCWISFYEGLLKERTGRMDIKTAILYQIDIKNGYYASKEPHLSWFCAAVKRAYPEHTPTVDAIMLLQ